MSRIAIYALLDSYGPSPCYSCAVIVVGGSTREDILCGYC